MRSRILLIAALVNWPNLSGAVPQPAHEHSRAEFQFTLDIPFADVAPLFGGWGERAWIDGWNPEFLHPTPPRDQEGAVFEVGPDAGKRTFITTLFDLAAGRMQHVFFVANVQVVKIDLWLNRLGARGTEVRVVYERTALTPEAGVEVRAAADRDRVQGERWKALIDRYWRGRQTGSR